MYCDLLTIGPWGHPSPPKHADVLNGWSLMNPNEKALNLKFFFYYLIFIHWNHVINKGIAQVTIWTYRDLGTGPTNFWQTCINPTPIKGQILLVVGRKKSECLKNGFKPLLLTSWGTHDSNFIFGSIFGPILGPFFGSECQSMGDFFSKLDFLLLLVIIRIRLTDVLAYSQRTKIRWSYR